MLASLGSKIMVVLPISRYLRFNLRTLHVCVESAYGVLHVMLHDCT